MSSFEQIHLKARPLKVRLAEVLMPRCSHEDDSDLIPKPAVLRSDVVLTILSLRDFSGDKESKQNVERWFVENITSTFYPEVVYW